MKARWEILAPTSAEAVQNIVNSLHLPRPIARTLVNRGLTDLNEVGRFLHPDADDLHNPFLLKDLERAVHRIIQALRERENILIYGDYDVDGITAVSLLYLFLRDLGGCVSFYIPDRASEGYGISLGGIEEARRSNCSLIVTVDCGITSTDEVELARSYGIDLIISDHHEPGERLPAAHSVINPKRPDCTYPFKELAGVGVAYKLAQGVLRTLEMPDEYVEKYLDLVAIGSAADIVPLLDENRVFVKLGLDKINRSPLEGVETLLETAGLHPGNVDVNQIVYGLAPRINAVGRLGRASPAVELLITRNHHQARKVADVLEEENRRRKEIDNHTLKQALEKLQNEYDPEHDRVIVLAQKDWHPGVIGIVASRLIERFYRPTVMISIENGVGKGSARSIPNFDLHSALKACSDLFIQFGGHKYAAGLSIAADRILEFKKRFNAIAVEMLSPEDLIPKIQIDDEVALGEITLDLVQGLARLAPFGPKNPRPHFVTYGAEPDGEPRIVGKGHLKFRVRQGNLALDAIAFGKMEDLAVVKASPSLDLVFTPEENNFLDRRTVQLKVKDLRAAAQQPSTNGGRHA